MLVERFLAVYLERIALESRPFPGAPQVLAELSAAGARLAVCTNKRTDLALALLQGTGLDTLFDVVIGADWGGPIKPDGAPLKAAMAAGGFHGMTGRAVMIGDSEIDVAAARAAGMPAVVFSQGYCATAASDLAADAVFDRWDQLPETLSRLRF